MATIETSENAKEEILQTHYYKASYDNIKELYLEYLKKLGHHIESINDDYSEVFSTGPHISVTAKIIMQNPKETSIDFFIDAEYLVASKKKAIKFVENTLNEIAKKYELKGISLHK